MAALSPGIMLTACGDQKKSARGFRLPDGDVENGKTAFVALDCHRCHSVSGVELPEYGGESPLRFELGGDVHRVKNYGQLVTSIINPDHVVSKKYVSQLPEAERKAATEDSPMPAANDNMTVAQMIDLVSFLQSRYTQIIPDSDWEYGGAVSQTQHRPSR